MSQVCLRFFSHVEHASDERPAIRLGWNSPLYYVEPTYHKGELLLVEIAWSGDQDILNSLSSEDQIKLAEGYFEHVDGLPLRKIPSQFTRKATFFEYATLKDEYSAELNGDEFSWDEYVEFSHIYAQRLAEWFTTWQSLAGTHERYEHLRANASLFGSEAPALGSVSSMHRRQLEKLGQSEFSSQVKQHDSIANLIESFTRLAKHSEMTEPLRLLGSQIANEPHENRESLVHLVQEKINKPLSGGLWFPWGEFWKLVGPSLPAKKPIKDIELPITEAMEIQVEYSWEYFHAHIVGPVVIGKPALRVHHPELGLVYIAGGRTLRFQTLRKGGRLRKFQCVLTADRNPASCLEAALSFVEQTDTLAQLSPLDALLLSSKGVDACMNELSKSTRQADRRMLADLLIAQETGFDPDVLRSKSREASSSKRWRRMRF